jgi:hypothetical protein
MLERLAQDLANFDSSHAYGRHVGAVQGVCVYHGMLVCMRVRLSSFLEVVGLDYCLE